MNGYIKLFRKLLDWEWYGDLNTRVTFIHLLMIVNYKPVRYKGMSIGAGQVLTSRQKLANEIGISEQSVRTALANLQSTNEITNESTNKGSLITVENWGIYQGDVAEINQRINQPANQQSTSNQPTKKKKDKNINNIYIHSANLEDSATQGKPSSSKVTALFEKLWKQYPNKRGKGQVSETSKRKIYDIGEEHMARAIDRYIAGLAADPWRKPQNGSTFFNSGYVDYLDENYEEPKLQTREPARGNSNAYIPEPPKYQKFERETETVKAEPMPDDIRAKLKNMF